ncbi:uncharacterized protein [Parasteatoda tepidariorum]|uniref:uncharacterized protein n=1 Tax=Parasteatoda tepidariorum TaxID=114398 RepID=UPI000A2C086E|nr:uncharacterized protein LOC107449845 isoform X3 [Parasteatoda tepidariorum]XP_042912533.1 uncharacterized protein LOC107449845 isoform X4 [Parasteatoda tepidariorum]
MEYLSPQEYRFFITACSKIKISFGPFCSIEEQFMRHLFNVFINLKNPEELKSLLELSNEMRVDFLRMFKDKPFMDGDLSHCCLMNNPTSFKLITDFGRLNEYQRRMGGLYLLHTAKFLQDFDYELSQKIVRQQLNELAEEDDNIPVQLRAYQVLCLYMGFLYGKKHPSFYYAIILLILWSSIPDPFLTFDDFEKSFAWMDLDTLMKTTKAWEWYYVLVRGPDSQEDGPRSLQHLARCTIRRSLKECFQLPNGIERLDIPKRLKQYLTLGDFKNGLTLNGEENNMIETLFQYRQQFLQ